MYLSSDSLLKKRLHPTLATKIRGKYGKASLKPHNTNRNAVEQNNSTTRGPSDKNSGDATTPATPLTPPTPDAKESEVVDTPPVSLDVLECFCLPCCTVCHLFRHST